MGRETVIKCSCERCNHTEEIKSSIFNRYPKGWDKVQKKLLCDVCYGKFVTVFRNFMDAGER